MKKSLIKNSHIKKISWFLGLVVLIAFASCGKKVELSDVPALPANLPTVLPSSSPVPLTDMTDTGNGVVFFLGPNGASNSKIAGGFRLRSGPGAANGAGELNGSTATTRLGGKAMLGFPALASQTLPIQASFTLKVTNVRIAGTSAQIYVNLIVDSNCDGSYNASGDAIVSLTITPNSSFVLAPATPISGIYNGSIAGVSVGSPFSSLYSKCLINVVSADNGMPKNKKIAGVLILVGDSTKSATSDVTYDLTSIDVHH